MFTEYAITDAVSTVLVRHYEFWLKIWNRAAKLPERDRFIIALHLEETRYDLKEHVRETGPVDTGRGVYRLAFVSGRLELHYTPHAKGRAA